MMTKQKRSGMRVWIVIAATILLSFGTHAQWVPLRTMSQNVVGLGTMGPIVFAGVEFGGLYRSTDTGSTWSYRTDGLPYNFYYQQHYFYPTVYCFTPSGSLLYAGTFKGFFVSSDSGMTWTSKSVGITSQTIKAIVNMGTRLCAGSDGGGVYLSDNGGESWTAYNTGLTAGTIRALVQKGSDLFAGTFGSSSGGVFRSTDKGITWTQASNGLGSLTTVVNCLAVSGTTLIAGTDGEGVYVSTNDGGSWFAATTGITDPFVRSMVASGSNIFVGTNGGGFYVSTDMGASWKQSNEGLTSTYVSGLKIFGQYLYAGTAGASGSPGGKVFRRPLSDLVSSIESPVASIPSSLILMQNYPNPFNPTTTIRYAIPARSHVTLSVFNALGQQVALLHDGEQEAGYHEVAWDGAQLSSGVYFYRIQSGSTALVRTLVLLK